LSSVSAIFIISLQTNNHVGEEDGTGMNYRRKNCHRKKSL